MIRTTLATGLLLLALVPALEAQRETAAVVPRTVAAVPFGPGEKVVYRVTYGILGKRGEAVSEIVGIDTIRGQPSYHLSFHLRGGVGPARVNDLQESWLDIGQLFSHRFRQNLNQPRYERLRTLDFFPADRMWRQVEKPESGPLASDRPLDDVSFLYWSRTLPLEVGRTYTFHRYFKESGNPVTVKVLRREQVTVPAGTFNTIVVQPLIRTSGLFSEGGEAEVYYTDDARRLIVLVKTKVTFGSMQLQLESYQPGQRLGASGGPARP
jgi:hypothetical protein